MNFIQKYKKDFFILGFFSLFVINSGLITYNFYYRFILIGIFNFILVWMLLKINPYKKKGLFCIFAFFLIVTPVLICSFLKGEKVPGLLIYIVYITSSIFAIFGYKSARKIPYAIIICYIFIFSAIALNHKNLLNYYNDLYEDKTNINRLVPLIKISDNKDKVRHISGNGKVQVIDLWSNSCAYCIADFPKFEKLKNDYVGDKNIEFFSLNVAIENFDQEKAEKFLKNYTFKNYYTDEKILKMLNFSRFPYYMIVAKDGRIKYFGNLNTDKLETYNNIYDIIDNEK